MIFSAEEIKWRVAVRPVFFQPKKSSGALRSVLDFFCRKNPTYVEAAARICSAEKSNIYESRRQDFFCRKIQHMWEPPSGLFLQKNRRCGSRRLFFSGGKIPSPGRVVLRKALPILGLLFSAQNPNHKLHACCCGGGGGRAKDAKPSQAGRAGDMCSAVTVARGGIREPRHMLQQQKKQHQASQ